MMWKNMDTARFIVESTVLAGYSPLGPDGANPCKALMLHEN